MKRNLRLVTPFEKWRIRQGEFWLQWTDGRPGWGEESMATVFNTTEQERVIALLAKMGVRACFGEKEGE